MSKVVARIDRDYINTDDVVVTRVGFLWTENEVRAYTNYHIGGVIIEFEDEQTRFRMKDDDGEVYYGGWLLNDAECIVQQLVLAWGAHDAGCTIIEIRRGEDWVTEIG